MNPEQPTREQIEARITALLLGELPAAEAELLRFTISRDPELQKLHDQLKVTIGFVREAMHPTCAPVERETPLKLAQERRQSLLAHFKTTRPQPPLIPLWRRQFKVSPLIGALAVIAIVAVLAAMLLPVLGTAKIRSLHASLSLREHSSSEGSDAIDDKKQISAAVKEWKLETGQAHVSPNSEVVNPGQSTIMQLPKIALPKTESTQTESEHQQAVGYINFAAAATSASVQAESAPPPSVAMDTPPPAPPAPEMQSQTGSPFISRIQSMPHVSPPESSMNGTTSFGESAPQPTAPQPAGQIPPKPAGGTYNVATPEALPNVKSSLTGINSSAGGGFGGFAGAGTAPVTNGTLDWYLGNQVASQSSGGGGGASAQVQQSPFQSRLQDNVTVAANGGVPTPPAGAFNFQSGLASSSTKNAIAMNDDKNGFYGAISGQGGEYERRTLSNRNQEDAKKVLEKDDTFGPSAAASEPPKVDNTPAAQIYLPPRLQQQYSQNERKLSDSLDKSQILTEGLASATASAESMSASAAAPSVAESPAIVMPPPPVNAATPPVEQSPRMGLENQTANAAVQSGGGLLYVDNGAMNPATDSRHAHKAPINPASGLPEAAPSGSVVPVVNGVPVTGELFPSSILRSPTTANPEPKDKARVGLPPPANAPTNAVVMNVNGVINAQAIDVNQALSVYAKLTGRTLLRSGIPSGTIISLRENSSETKEEKIKGLESALAAANVAVVNIGDKFAKVLPANEASSAGEASQAVSAPTEPSTPPLIPQPEVLTSDNAFSTFSMNVSDVSFKFAMASLEKGQMPAPASIRSEEFINAFDYRDPEPLQGEPLAFTSERASDPFAQERDMLRFSIKAAAVGRQQGRALNLVLLLDTSGSMERADRVAIIREALRVLSGQLQPQDVVSVVTFARTARLWADGIPGNEAGATLDRVGSITPEGGTNLEEAMRLAYETALRHFISGGMNRVVLLTDGAANLGNVDPQALTQKVDSERRQGIALDCFGIGWDDYNDDLLEQLSSNGDGRYAFINSPDEAATEFAAKLAGALEVAAEDVKVQVEFNPNRVTAWRQIGYAKHQLTKQQFRDNTVAAGAIASREAGNALYVIETNPDGQGPIATVRVRYRVPGTQDFREHSWSVDYTGAAPDLAQSSPAMRLAVTAAEVSEWMADSPFAQDVTPDELLNYLSGVPEVYGTDERPKQLEWMIRDVISGSGK